MNKKLIIDVFGALYLHVFFSCCTALLVKGAACQLESYDYIYDKEEFWTFRLSGALRDTRGFMFNTMSVLDLFTSFFMSF